MSNYFAYKYLRPELLSRAELLEALKSRCFTDLDRLSKEELIEIFRKNAMPLPQRQFTGKTAHDARHREHQASLTSNKMNSLSQQFENLGRSDDSMELDEEGSQTQNPIEGPTK